MNNLSADQRTAIYFLTVWLLLFFIIQSIYAIIPAVLLISTCLSKALANRFIQLLHLIAKINSTLLLMITFYLILTPFSFFYRLLWQHYSYKRNVHTTFRPKKTFSAFDQPF